MGAPGPASQYPIGSQQESFQGAVKFQGIKHICGACRDMPARGPEMGRYNVPVKMDRYR
jgi:hypothetical protein